MKRALDHQRVPRLTRAVFRRTLLPLRRFLLNRYFLKHRLSDIQKVNKAYAFYPLHTEPELTLHVYAREFVNQIEIIRLIAQSLPTGMALVVKEHPATVGRRKISYYKKLLQIPNVILIKTDTSAFDIIQGSSIVFVITGTTALEAIYIGKPVIYFGHVPYSYLPSHTVQRADIYRFSDQIRGFMKSFQMDERAVCCFIAATMASSAKVNLITEVLGKKRLNVQNDALSYSENISRLSNLLETRLRDHQII